MTYEEAMQSVLTYCVEECREIDTCKGKNLNCVEAVVIQALEKQIPKKPIRYVTAFPSCCIVSKCPNCEQEFGFNSDFNFCENCGQRLDFRSESIDNEDE